LVLKSKVSAAMDSCLTANVNDFQPSKHWGGSLFEPPPHLGTRLQSTESLLLCGLTSAACKYAKPQDQPKPNQSILRM